MKPFVVHNTPTLSQTSSKIIVSCACLLWFRLCLLNITQAYLQSKDKLTRAVFIKPKEQDRPYFKVRPDQVLQPVKPLYVMCDSGDYWGATLTEHVRNHMQMMPLTGDPSLFMKKSRGNTIGVLGRYMDDCLFAGNVEFNEVVNKTQKRFESKPVEWDSVEFRGVQIVTRRENNTTWFEINQIGYIERLQQIPSNASFERFRPVRANLSCLCHTRPDICCAVNRACQVVEKKFDKSKIRAINKLIRRLKKSKTRFEVPQVGLEYCTHPCLFWRFICVKWRRKLATWVLYSIVRWKQQVPCPFVLQQEVEENRKIHYGWRSLRFFCCIWPSFVIRLGLQEILNQKISLTMFTDSKQLFDVLTTAAHTTEKRLMVEIMAAREAYNRFEISNVGLVSGRSNPARGLTKPGISIPLNKLLYRGADNTNLEQWIYRRG